MTQDYRPTIFLPQTDFPMRGNLPEKEPEHCKRWEEMGIYDRAQEVSKDRSPFILHDGPPYANGNIHAGHATNKILKDVIVRSQFKLGKRTPFVPGWDCHGLPIETKVEETYRKKGMNKDDVPMIQFRKECREFAQTWIDVQREEFKRLGIMGDWDHPYTTMTGEAEAEIVRLLGEFLLKGGLYRGVKPVMWSVIEKTALAEAEVAVKSEDKEKMEEANKKLTEASGSLAQKLYAEQQAAGQNTGESANAKQDNADDGVVDAEFEEVKDEK